MIDNNRESLCLYVRPPGFWSWLFNGWYLASICANANRIHANLMHHQEDGYMTMATVMPRPLPLKFRLIPKNAKVLSIYELKQLIVAEREPHGY